MSAITQLSEEAASVRFVLGGGVWGYKDDGRGESGQMAQADRQIALETKAKCLEASGPQIHQWQSEALVPS